MQHARKATCVAPGRTAGCAGGLAWQIAIRVLARAPSFCYRHGAFDEADGLFRGSSAVEQPAVNRLVAGSNPARGAISSKSRVARACRPATQSTKPHSRSLRPPLHRELAPPTRGPFLRCPAEPVPFVQDFQHPAGNVCDTTSRRRLRRIIATQSHKKILFL